LFFFKLVLFLTYADSTYTALCHSLETARGAHPPVKSRGRLRFCQLLPHCFEPLAASTSSLRAAASAELPPERRCPPQRLAGGTPPGAPSPGALPGTPRSPRRRRMPQQGDDSVLSSPPRRSLFAKTSPRRAPPGPSELRAPTEPGQATAAREGAERDSRHLPRRRQRPRRAASCLADA